MGTKKDPGQGLNSRSQQCEDQSELLSYNITGDGDSCQKCGLNSVLDIARWQCSILALPLSLLSTCSVPINTYITDICFTTLKVYRAVSQIRHSYLNYALHFLDDSRART